MKHVSLIALMLVAGCSVGPDYHRPDVTTGAGFKEAAAAPEGWKLGTPGDTIPKGAWWTIYHDPVLEGLEGQVALSNQNIKSFEAQYRQAQAITDEARSQELPTVGVSGGVTRSRSSSSGSNLSGGSRARTTYTAEGTATWDLDLWGKIRRQVESDQAGADVSAADLANATLSAQETLANDYFQLRGQDALTKLLADTVKADQEALRITQNQYDAGTAAPSDVAAAETELATAQAQLIAAGVTRQQFEHAIAVLTGVPPSALTLPPGQLATDVPVAPPGLPSALLERRPDIAAAERAMAEQNALIGVAVAAYYPDISLSADYGFEGGNPIGKLFRAANRIWSLGASASETLFDGGERSAAVRAAEASYDSSVASYRQTVLTAFQQVEDELSDLRILQQQSGAEDAAVRAAQHSLEIALNEYRAGTVAYTTVVTAQTALLSNQEAALTVQQNRLVASATLVAALGGGWSEQDLAAR